MISDSRQTTRPGPRRITLWELTGFLQAIDVHSGVSDPLLHFMESKRAINRLLHIVHTNLHFATWRGW